MESPHEPQPWRAQLRVAMILTAVMIVVVGTTTAITAAIWGGSKALASAVAGAVCWVGGLGACAWPPGEVSATAALVRLLGGIALRAGLPLAVGIAVQIADGPLAREGFVYYVLMFYLATLGVETYLFVPRARSARPPDRRPENESR